MEPSSRSIGVTRPAATASGLARIEARRLGHHYLGPEHLLIGLLVEGDNPAAMVLATYGLDLEAARTEVDRLIAQVVLPSPQPSDTELLASLGVDLEAVHARVQQAFGEQAYWEAVQRVQHRPAQAVTHAPSIPTDPSPLVCGRALRIAYDEAVARDQEIGVEHLLFGVAGRGRGPGWHRPAGPGATTAHPARPPRPRPPPDQAAGRGPRNNPGSTAGSRDPRTRPPVARCLDAMKERGLRSP
jgi:Clp amino terminal domain, pathogenicity island component